MQAARCRPAWQLGATGWWAGRHCTASCWACPYWTCLPPSPASAPPKVRQALSAQLEQQPVSTQVAQARVHAAVTLMASPKVRCCWRSVAGWRPAQRAGPGLWHRQGRCEGHCGGPGLHSHERAARQPLLQSPHAHCSGPCSHAGAAHAAMDRSLAPELLTNACVSQVHVGGLTVPAVPSAGGCCNVEASSAATTVITGVEWHSSGSSGSLALRCALLPSGATAPA